MTLKLKVDELSVRQFKKDLDNIAARLKEEAVKAVEARAKVVKTNAQAETPVRTGALRDSAFHSVKYALKQAKAYMGYAPRGNTAYHYAIEVHELHRTKAKFLERAVHEESSVFLAEIVRNLKPLFRGGI